MAMQPKSTATARTEVKSNRNTIAGTTIHAIPLARSRPPVGGERGRGAVSNPSGVVEFADYNGAAAEGQVDLTSTLNAVPPIMAGPAESTTNPTDTGVALVGALRRNALDGAD